jgi:hypothetical protein
MLQKIDASGAGQTPSVTINRADYTAPAYWIDTVELCFDLDATKTRVLNKMKLRRNADLPVQPLKLDGDELNLARVLVNGQGTSFRMEGSQLVLDNLPDEFELEIFTTCNPSKNTKLMGLYVSNDSFFTQCEAEGFRRITYFLDRPDVMAMLHGDLARRQGQIPGAAVQRQPGRQRRPAGPDNVGATLPNGSTRTKNPATCLRWWPASWSAASSASPRAPATSTCCRSMCAPATWTRPSTR